MARLDRIENTGLIPAHAGSTPGCFLLLHFIRAHPRSRGVDRGLLYPLFRPLGSSPLTRGRHCVAGFLRLGWRLIPAHAGSTFICAHFVDSERAHPRSRGVDLSQNSPIKRIKGSSPLTRGRRARDTTIRAAQRLIPAHAGSTVPPPLPINGTRAHPRSRGVDQHISPNRNGNIGSSPLTRGRLRTIFIRIAGVRLIPAHAGSTERQSGFLFRLGAHPRSRGVDAG